MPRGIGTVDARHQHPESHAYLPLPHWSPAVLLPLLQCTPRRAGTAHHRVFRPQAGKTNGSGAGDAAAAAAAATAPRPLARLYPYTPSRCIT